MRGARCTAERTTTQRELVLARPEREAHQETAEKTQCVVRRPAGCAENAREMVPDEATQRESEPESELEPELVNTEWP